MDNNVDGVQHAAFTLAVRSMIHAWELFHESGRKWGTDSCSRFLKRLDKGVPHKDAFDDAMIFLRALETTFPDVLDPTYVDAIHTVNDLKANPCIHAEVWHTPAEIREWATRTILCGDLTSTTGNFEDIEHMREEHRLYLVKIATKVFNEAARRADLVHPFWAESE